MTERENHVTSGQTGYGAIPNGGAAEGEFNWQQRKLRCRAPPLSPVDRCPPILFFLCPLSLYSLHYTVCVRVRVGTCVSIYVSIWTFTYICIFICLFFVCLCCLCFVFRRFVFLSVLLFPLTPPHSQVSHPPILYHWLFPCQTIQKTNNNRKNMAAIWTAATTLSY